MINESIALVVLSGGQDSTTCVGIALKKHSHVYAISFDYGQRHVVELDCAKNLCTKYEIPHNIVKLDFLPKLVISALTEKESPIDAKHFDHSNLPASFVPNRNALFLTIAHAYAQTIKADYLYTGMCQVDGSGYPDCRNVFKTSLQTTLNLGAEVDIEVIAPLITSSKGEIFKLADEYDFLEEVLENSHTCYEGNRENRFDWGYGCGECPSCKIRAEGYRLYLEQKELMSEKE